MSFTSLINNIIGKRRKVQFIQNDKTVFEIECTLDETHTRESPPTTFPVEDGSTIADHIILKNHSLKIHGIISDTPLSVAGAALTTGIAALVPGPLGVIGAAVGTQLFSSVSAQNNPSVAAYLALLKLQELKQPVTVITTLNRYDNMYLSSISVPRSAETGNILEFTADLTELIIVSSLSVQIQIFNNGDLAAGEQNLGKQQKKPAGADQFIKGENKFLSAVGQPTIPTGG